MRKTEAALWALAIVALLGAGVGAASAATPGFAVYKVQFSAQGYSYTLTVNETVSATASPSTDNLALKVAAQTWNFNYSRSINSSSEVSPFLPSITNQSFSLGTGANAVAVSLVSNGTTQTQFAGHSYSLTDYSLSATGTVNGTAASVRGAIAAFPSGLVYSVTFYTSGVSIPATSFPNLAGNKTSLISGPASVSLTLLSTSLPLNASSPSTTAQAASIGIGAGVAVSALALGLGVRHRGKSKAAAPEEKPEHWVD